MEYVGDLRKKEGYSNSFYHNIIEYFEKLDSQRKKNGSYLMSKFQLENLQESKLALSANDCKHSLSFPVKGACCS